MRPDVVDPNSPQHIGAEGILGVVGYCLIEQGRLPESTGCFHNDDPVIPTGSDCFYKAGSMEDVNRRILLRYHPIEVPQVLLLWLHRRFTFV